MRRFLAILLCSLCCLSAAAQQRWAVVVGISTYPATSGWSDISGENDFELVVPMLTRCGFAEADITTLANAQATKAAIVGSLQRLALQARRGDVVYIHFSCHGQLITDVDGDEGDGWDEALIPYDAKIDERGGYNGENHLVDDELNALLAAIKHRIGDKGRVVVVVDACYSGGVSRQNDEAAEDVIVRGARKKFDLLPVAEPTRREPLAIDWLCISACQSYQVNQEYKPDEVSYGRLSYAMSRVLEPSLSVERLQELIEEQYEAMPRRYPQQAMFDVEPSLTKQSVMQ